MKLISRELEQKLINQENNRNCIIKARLTLEETLIYQFRQLAIGLYAYQILTEHSIGNEEYKRIYEFINDKTIFEENELTEFKNSFAMDIITKNIKVISLDKLKDIKIRIYNKDVHLWEGYLINEQLSILGSSLRFFFAGNDTLSLIRIKELIGYPSNDFVQIDGRFILGHIGAISTTYFGPVYDFIDELAISPFFDDRAPGFTIEETVVIRRNVIQKALQKSDVENSDLWLHTFIHETLHSSSYAFKDGLLFAKGYWRIYTERDICRYLNKPRKFEEIKKTFFLNFEHPDIAILAEHGSDILDINIFRENLGNLQCILQDMIKTGKIIEKDKECFVCCLYEQGKEWELS